MRRVKGRSRGFTLIASLLVLALLSAIAVSLLFMVQGAGQVGNNDLETNRAYYGAESGMELLTANLAALYQQSQSPTPLQITNLTNSPPTNAMIKDMGYQESITWTPDANGNPASRPSVISAGPNAGLTAEIIPLTLNVRATRPGGASVNMTRGVEVALIPVFQFGVFSDSDLSYFAGPNFNFAGRVHTNGNLFLAEGNGNNLVLDDKVTAVREILRDRLANNFLTNANYTGEVYVLNQSHGCDGSIATATNPALSPHCLKFSVPLASWSAGIPAAGVQTNVPTWTNTSTTVSPTTFGGWIGNNTSMAVQPLTLPFVQGANGAAQQIAIIRKAPFGEPVSSATGSSREYNKANVRILLASTQADLHPDRPGLLAEDIDLTAGGCAASPQGLAVAVKGVGGAALGTTRIAMAKTVTDPGWVGPPTLSPCPAAGPWNLVDGWLRVEYQNAAGAWVGVTTEWLQLGFARGLVSPTKPVGGGAGSNPVHPNAILILQEQADRDAVCPGGVCTADAPNNVFDGGTLSQYSWYPINFYDPREGFPRDTAPAGMANPACYVNGIMNAVEFDVGNFRKWLLGTVPGGNGPLVSYSSQNGYLVYFSDRRGMIANPDPGMGGITNGEYGFEDVINSGSATGTPDNVLEASEDVDQNNIKDNWGAVDVGYGQRVATVVAGVPNPYVNVNCSTRGRQNIVTGARHALKLVDGGLGNLPVRPDTGLGGFTVASENPVYIQGNYNSDNTDPFWNNPPPAAPADINHSAAAVIADAVTVLSNNWSDTNSMLNPLNLGGRAPNTPTYYRLAIAGGKNINFPQPAGTGQDFGTDGGVHNFLRYIETWGGSGGLYYRGSLVSLYYAQYATGTFKCCNLVYGPPPRYYYFDTAFLDPAKLPPGTPMLQDVVNLTYWQDFKPY